MAGPEFRYSNDKGPWQVTEAMKEAYNTHGYIIVRNLIKPEEVKKVRVALEDPEGVTKYSFSRSDGKNRANKLSLWNHLGRDITGVLARTHRIAGTMEQLMGGKEIYHYHTKLIMKEARTGGTYVWHQDYGYWYKNGCLSPDMGSVFTPMDDTDRGNGCLQVLAGSHKYGRIDHIKFGEQFGADLERVEQAKKKLKHVYVELKAGDVLFFHCNLLHTSDQNHSDRRRWVFITAFNQRDNDPYMDHHHPRYTPMTKVEDSAVMACDVVRDMEGKWFMVYEDDENLPHTFH